MRGVSTRNIQNLDNLLIDAIAAVAAYQEMYLVAKCFASL